ENGVGMSGRERRSALAAAAARRQPAMSLLEALENRTLLTAAAHGGAFSGIERAMLDRVGHIVVRRRVPANSAHLTVATVAPSLPIQAPTAPQPLPQPSGDGAAMPTPQIPIQVVVTTPA